MLVLLGSAEWRAGQPDAIAHLQEALAGAGEDLDTLISASTMLALAYNVTGQAEDAVNVLERLLAAVADRDVGLASIVEAALVLVGLVNERTAPAASHRAERLRAHLDELAHPPVQVLVMLAHHAARANRADAARNLARRALADGPYPPPLEFCPPLILALTRTECYEELQRLCEDLLVAARQRGAIQETIAILLARATASCDRGALADAEADLRWALPRAGGVREVHAVSELVRVLIERDELQNADDVLTQCPDPCGSRSIEVLRFLAARGQLRVAQRRLEDALADFLDCGQRCARLGLEKLSAAPWRAEAALVHSALANTQEAQRLAHEQLELARAFDRPRILGISLRVCGLVDRGERGLKWLVEAIETLEGARSPIELARARSDYGAGLRRAGRRVQARAELERALDLAHHLGAQRIANQVRAELVAAGAKPRRDAITGRDALTAAELRVARLAAQGLTNREIAQALFITTKTATGHLSHIYRKLEITSRGQLADALAVQLDTSHGPPGAGPRLP